MSNRSTAERPPGRRFIGHVTTASVATSAAAAMALAGCTSGDVSDRAGTSVKVLHFAVIDTANPNGQTVAPKTFLQALVTLSGGRLKVSLETEYESGKTTAESDIVRAMVSGALDGGWPVTRAFHNAGITSLDTVETPLLLSSYDAERAVATGKVGQDLLHTLDRTGVVGLGLTVGALRRPWSVGHPLLGPADWRGVTMRSYNSAVQDATIRALGAVPVAASFNLPDLIRAGSLKAIETDVAQFQVNHYGPILPNATSNVVLWPRMSVLSLSRKRWNSLTTQERGWVTEAAQKAVQASVDYHYDDSAVARSLCGQGVSFVPASNAQVMALLAATRPVLDALSADPVNGTLLKRIEAVSAEHPDPDALTVPATCQAPRPKAR